MKRFLFLVLIMVAACSSSSVTAPSTSTVIPFITIDRLNPDGSCSWNTQWGLFTPPDSIQSLCLTGQGIGFDYWNHPIYAPWTPVVIVASDDSGFVFTSPVNQPLQTALVNSIHPNDWSYQHNVYVNFQLVGMDSPPFYWWTDYVPFTICLVSHPTVCFLMKTQ